MISDRTHRCGGQSLDTAGRSETTEGTRTVKHKLLFATALLMAAVATAAPAPATAGPTLDAVKERGFLRCGVRGDLVGFSAIDADGQWAGLDVDVCRAVAAAVLGDGKHVEFIPLNASARFPALQAGEIDVLSRNTTWTFGRDTTLGVDFVGVTFYDGQAFLARKSLGATSLQELKPGVRICYTTNTTTETNLADFAESHDLDYRKVPFQSTGQAAAGLFAGRCDLLTTDRSGLASIRAADVPNPEDFIILADVISKEPLGPVVRDGDPGWREIVQWVVFATIEAEEKGIGSANAEAKRASADPAVTAMLGAVPGIGKGLGLDDQWAYRVIRQVGNYGEIFERNVGLNTALALERGLNALWTNGGLMYAPPLR